LLQRVRTPLLAIAIACVPAVAGARSGANAPHELIDRTWRHVTTIDRCHLRLEPASAGEQARLIEVAHARFGKRATIELTPLGDRIARIGGPIAFDNDRPQDKREAIAMARQFVTEHADILGIADEVDKLRLAGVNSRTGDGYLITGSLYRSVEGLAMSAGITIAVDNRGAIAWLAVTADMLPVFTLCDVPVLDPNGMKVRRKILGRHLPYVDATGNHDSGPIAAKDVGEATTRVVRLSDTDVQRVLAIQVTRRQMHWMFLVDGETGEVVRIDEMFGAAVDYP
jgi:hypothetical protein